MVSARLIHSAWAYSLATGRRYGGIRMSKLSQGNLFSITAVISTPSSAARPVSPQATRGSDSAPPMIVGCGLTFCAWCMRSTTRRNGRSCGCWRKTLAESLHCALRDWNSTNGLRVNLELEVTTSCPSSWLLKTSARHTEEKDSSTSDDWPTPVASDYHSPQCTEKYMGRKTGKRLNHVLWWLGRKDLARSARFRLRLMGFPVTWLDGSGQDRPR